MISKGDRVRVKGLAGQAVVLEVWTMPGEQEARVKVEYRRNGKPVFRHGVKVTHTDHESNVEPCN